MLLLLHLSYGMASFLCDLLIQESEYFNWHCVICSKLGLSPMELESQHMTYDFSIYSDVNDEKQVKCDDCMSPFHLKCAMSEPEHVVANKRFVCTFFSCKKN